MNRLKFFAVLVALLAVISCSDSNDPVSPNRSLPAALSSQQECGEDAYLVSLAPVLVDWKDSIDVWLGTELDTVPDYDGEPESYINDLIPSLSQWQTAINDSLDSVLVDMPPAYEEEDTPGTYLSKLAPTIDQWEGALEGYRGVEFLADAPVYTPDETAPVLSCPGDTTIECADTSGFAVEFEVTAEDDCDPAPVVSCDYESGDVFHIGETVVTCTATDASGNTSECSFTITVVAAEPPTITCPPDTTVECQGDGSAMVEFVVTAESECDDSLVVECDPPSGSDFPLGETVVNCSVTDRFGNTAECSFSVFVEDTTPPSIDNLSLSKDYLWPPNHRMHDVDVTIEASDLCSSEVTAWVYDVTSDEPINGVGDGNTEPDFMIVGDTTVRLRAERAGPEDGRTYTIHVRVEDGSGNMTEGSIDIMVPHDMGDGAARPDDGADDTAFDRRR